MYIPFLHEHTHTQPIVPIHLSAYPEFLNAHMNSQIVANDTTGTIRYQYFGGASGVTRYYPGTQWHSVDFPYTTSSADTDDPRALFDARVAPW